MLLRFFQDVSLDPVDKHMQPVWNEDNQVPMHEWLNAEIEPAQRSSLHMLGNCVVPAMASLAFEILLRIKAQGERLD